MRSLPLRLAAAPLAVGFTVALTACSTGSTDEAADSVPSAQTTAEADAFPVTIEHAFGETTIEEEPTRVATVGWTDQDHVAALGVVPVGATKITWGGNDNGSSDWFDAAVEDLGGQAPTRYDDTDGVPVDDIAKLEPDVILATNSGITKADYKKLTAIAPVVAYPEGPWVTDWQDSLEMVGEALGRSQRADEIEAETEQVIEDTSEAHPELDGASFIYAYLTTTDLSTIGIYAPEDPRVAVLHDFGMEDAPAVADAIEPGQFYGSVSAENAPELESDVVLTWTESAQDAQTYEDDRLIGQIPAIKAGNFYAETDKQAAMNGTNPTPLSIPVLAENVIPKIVDALKG